VIFLEVVLDEKTLQQSDLMLQRFAARRSVLMTPAFLQGTTRPLTYLIRNLAPGQIWLRLL